MTLIAPDQPAPVIVIAADPSPSETYAAHELAAYLEKITGTQVKITDDSHDPPANAKIIAVGQSKLTASINTADLHHEQSIIDVQPDRIAIVGGRRHAAPGQPARDAGTLYGVYDLLDHLGVRWYRPEPWGEHVPTLKTVTLQIGKTASPLPAFAVRAAMGGGKSYSREETAQENEETRDWGARNRLNAFFCTPDLAPKFGGIELYSMGTHNWPFLIPPSDYFDAHPEYFALVDGERVPYDLCPANPDVQKRIAQKIIDQAKKDPHLSSLSVEPSDARGGSCQCDLCKALDQPLTAGSDGKFSNRLAAFGNVIARAAAKEVPWLKIQWLAYSTHTAAPTNVKQLEPNTTIMLCPINGWDDWRGDLFDASNRQNIQFVNMAKDWAALQPDSLMAFLYCCGYGWPGPLPITRTLADRVQGYRTLGLTGLYLPAVISWGPAGLDFYMYMKLVWNPDLDLDAELNLYYQNYYGPAAAPMKAYHERLMQALADAPQHVFSGGRGMHYIFTPALINELTPHMEKARALVKSNPLYEHRLQGVWAGYEFARRVSDLLVLKKNTGTLTTKAPEDENLQVPPDLARPAFTGSGAYYQSPKAEQAYRELILWMRSVNNEDPVFDMAVHPQDDAAQFIFPKRSQNFGSPFLSYLPHDLLITINQNANEKNLLKDF
jgi:hypothetical protein